MNFLSPYQQQIEMALQQKISHFGPETKLQQACRYALLNGGKRFRPALVLMVAKAIESQQDVMDVALGIEYFHTASLIADDLPCMDDDDFRRDKPSTHKVFGEDVALLATYALIAEGYACMARNKAPSLDVYRLALENTTHNTGLNGATGGQYLDISPPDLSLETVREVLQKKTVSLFEISFVLGWLYGGGDLSRLETIKKAALHFGMAFQIADDFGDQEQDRINGRAINLPNLIGVEAAKKMFHVELSSYFETLKELGLEKSEMARLPEFLK